MKRKREKAERNKRHGAEVKLLSLLEQTTRLLQLEQLQESKVFLNRRWMKLCWKRRHLTMC
jgi:hypothetical protein